MAILGGALVVPFCGSQRPCDTRCEVVVARPENPFGAESGLIEPGWENHTPEGFYIAKTLVRDRREVPFRFLNATYGEQT
jgi:hypothetical protein